MRIAVFYSAFANNRTLAALLTQAQITLFSSTSYGGRYFLEQHLQWSALRIPIGTTIIQVNFPGGRSSGEEPERVPNGLGRPHLQTFHLSSSVRRISVKGDRYGF